MMTTPKSKIPSTTITTPASKGQLADRNEDAGETDVTGVDVAVGVAVTFSVLACCCAYAR